MDFKAQQIVLELSEPLVLSCFFDDSFAPALPAMRLQWAEAGEFSWNLPGGLRLAGGPPATFGLRLQRLASQSFAVYLRWNELCLHWRHAHAHDIHGSSLDPVLAALKSDLGWLLEQPLEEGAMPLHRVA